MPFKLSDWKRLMARYALARSQVGQFRLASQVEEDAPRHLLDSAVISIHSTGEYTVNVMLELAGSPPERHHRAGDRARELKAAGRIQGDYRRILDQLQRYRLAAQYLGYGQTPSTHYNATNLETALSEIDLLIAEAVAALRAAGIETV